MLSHRFVDIIIIIISSMFIEKQMGKHGINVEERKMMKMRRKSSFVNRQRFDEMASIFRKSNRNKLFRIWTKWLVIYFERR